MLDCFHRQPQSIRCKPAKSILLVERDYDFGFRIDHDGKGTNTAGSPAYFVYGSEENEPPQLLVLELRCDGHSPEQRCAHSFVAAVFLRSLPGQMQSSNLNSSPTGPTSYSERRAVFHFDILVKGEQARIARGAQTAGGERGIRTLDRAFGPITV